MSGDSLAADQAKVLLDELEARRQFWSDRAKDLQHRSRAFALFVALLSPLAVALLSIQLLAFREAGPVAVTLVSLELAALAAAVLIGLIRAEHWQTAWVRARVRAELLRREPFLFRARVGPYLSSSSPADLERRLRLLNTEVTPVEELLESQDAGVPWRDALEDHHSDPPEPSFESEYLNGRVRDQRDWYALRSARHSMLDGRYEGWAFACLSAGFALAAFHLGLLVSGKHPAREITLAVEIAAVVLPPVGACLLAIRTHVESHRLARSYEIQARELTLVEQRLMALPAAGNPSAERRRLLLLKRLVLRTEELFTQEFRQWMLIVEPERPTPGG